MAGLIIGVDLREKLSAAIENIAKEFDSQLVDLKITQYQNNTSIEVLADKTCGGITLKECSLINKELCLYIDESGLLDPERYTVEVNSPGLDRPLKTESDFLRVKGRPVRFYLAQKLEGRLEYDGKVESVKEGVVRISYKDKQVDIPIADINKAIQII